MASSNCLAVVGNALCANPQWSDAGNLGVHQSWSEKLSLKQNIIFLGEIDELEDKDDELVASETFKDWN